ncbi:hypothetical protein HYW41_04365 [Candidatus Daviesbacteria bacterium]|nr:hypothetical protein [Candidatus Daviesbacteria bacterium]
MKRVDSELRYSPSQRGRKLSMIGSISFAGAILTGSVFAASPVIALGDLPRGLNQEVPAAEPTPGRTPLPVLPIFPPVLGPGPDHLEKLLVI